MSEFIVIDDEMMPIRDHHHFAIRDDRLQIKTSIIGAHYILDIMALRWRGVGAILKIIEAARYEGVEWTKIDALVELANRRLMEDRREKRGAFSD